MSCRLPPSWSAAVISTGHLGATSAPGSCAKPLSSRLANPSNSVAPAKAFYHLQRSKGKGHAAALRALAFKWIRIIWKSWQTRTPYDEARYLAQLRKTKSPLIPLLEATTS